MSESKEKRALQQAIVELEALAACAIKHGEPDKDDWNDGFEDLCGYNPEDAFRIGADQEHHEMSWKALQGLNEVKRILG